MVLAEHFKALERLDRASENLRTARNKLLLARQRGDQDRAAKLRVAVARWEREFVAAQVALDLGRRAS